MKKRLALLLTASMLATLMAGCGGKEASGTGGSDEPQSVTGSTDASEPAGAEEVPEENKIDNLVMYALASQECSTLVLLHSEKGSESFAANFTDGWLTNKPDGSIDYLLADSYESNEDGTVWTFHLRDDAVATWVDYQGNYKADVVVEDWITSAEYILNFWKNEGWNSAMLTSTVEGAAEYYEYTKGLSEEEALALDTEKFKEMVNIVADPDANTVTYTCAQPCPYFYTLGFHKCTLPLSAAQLEEVGAGNYNAISNTDLWYCGPYTMTSFVSGNEKVLTKNESYWNIDNVDLFDSVTIKMIDSLDVGYTLYETGEIDQIELSQSSMYSIMTDESHPFHDYLVKKVTKEPSYTIEYNYAKKNEDGTPDTDWNTAAANEAFRLSISYGVDLLDYFTRIDPVNPYSIASYTVTHGRVAYTEDGTDYKQLVLDRLGIEPSDDAHQRLDMDLANQYKEQAIEELTAKGVTFPINIDYYVASGNQTALDTANVMQKAFEDGLGSDYVTFTIKTYISSAIDEVYTPSLQSIALSSWGQDFGDPVNSVGNFTLDDTAVFTRQYTHFGEVTDPDCAAQIQEFCDMVEKADATVEVDARLNAFADAEAYLIQHGLVCPLYLDVGWQLTKVNDYSMLQAGSGSQGSRYVNWETNSEGYTTEEFDAFRAERNSK